AVSHLRRGQHQRRFFPEQVARGVHAVDSEVEHRATTQIGTSTNIVRSDDVAEDRIEDTRVADLSRLYELDSFEVRLLEVQAIRDHQLDLRAPARVGHFLSVGYVGRQRLFAQHMRTGGSRA